MSGPSVSYNAIVTIENILQACSVNTHCKKNIEICIYQSMDL